MRTESGRSARPDANPWVAAANVIAYNEVLGAARKILDDALALPPEERAALVDALSESLEPVNVSPEWRDEIRRRIEAIERGEAELVPWAEVRARLRSKIDTR